MFRAGTSSRLKRLGLFRSCRWEASPKAQGLSEDASHHAREHKTPTEGTAHGIHRSVPENQRIRHSGFFVLPLKVCCPSAKKFSDRPLFQKGAPGCRAGSPVKSVKEGEASGTHRLRHSKINGSGIPGSLPFHKKVCCPSAEKVFGSTPFSKGVAGLQGEKPCKKYKKGARVKNEQEKQNKGCAIFDCTALFSLQEHRKNTQSSSLMLAFASAIIFWASLPGTSS